MWKQHFGLFQQWNTYLYKKGFEPFLDFLSFFAFCNFFSLVVVITSFSFSFEDFLWSDVGDSICILKLLVGNNWFVSSNLKPFEGGKITKSYTLVFLITEIIKKKGALFDSNKIQGHFIIWIESESSNKWQAIVGE